MGLAGCSDRFPFRQWTTHTQLASNYHLRNKSNYCTKEWSTKGDLHGTNQSFYISSFNNTLKLLNDPLEFLDDFELHGQHLVRPFSLSETSILVAHLLWLRSAWIRVVL